jgi:hypothetical protein
LARREIDIKKRQQPDTKYSIGCRINDVMRRESRCSRRVFAIDAAFVALHDKAVLLVGAGSQFGQPAPLSLDARGALIGRAPAPLHGLDHNDDHGRDTDDPPEQLDRQGNANSSTTNCNMAGA